MSGSRRAYTLSPVLVVVEAIGRSAPILPLLPGTPERATQRSVPNWPIHYGARLSVFRRTDCPASEKSLFHSFSVTVLG